MRDAAGAVPTPKGRSGATIPGEYFRALYRRSADPWNFAASEYERRKYRTTLAALPRERYRSALELGCSIGVFTRMLAERCDDVLAVDVSGEALAQAAYRCAGMAHVRFAACELPGSFPAFRGDLVTLCELGFYFGPADLARIRDGIAASLEPGGDVLLVHWTPLVEGHAQTADDVHEAFLADPRFVRGAHADGPTYRLDHVSRRR
ncbi:MAG TPA: SAM-dependent methyltransferase [Dongiaceae bacterium]|nr:SAM-dependent methyltransferase [Dongiaceae bacterium]